LILAEVFKIDWAVCAVLAIAFFMRIKRREALIPFGLVSIYVWADIENAELDGGYAFFLNPICVDVCICATKVSTTVAH
jgi:hypothetical protein